MWFWFFGLVWVFSSDIAFSVQKGLLQPALRGIFYQNLLPCSRLAHLAQEARSKTVCEVRTPCSLQATVGTGSLD